MLLRVGHVLLVVTANIGICYSQIEGVTVKPPSPPMPDLLPSSFKDVFIGSSGGKPVYGMTSTTCWARGGVCVDIRECPMLRMDPAVAGCTRGFKVCCKSFKQQPPTVGIHRRFSEVKIYSPNLEELNGDTMDSIAANNNHLLMSISDYPDS